MWRDADRNARLEVGRGDRAGMRAIGQLIIEEAAA
jgi:hypothetical protein